MGWDFPGGTNKDEQDHQWSAVRKATQEGFVPVGCGESMGRGMSSQLGQEANKCATAERVVALGWGDWL